MKLFNSSRGTKLPLSFRYRGVLLRFMGLKWGRIAQWRAVLQEEEVGMDWRAWLHMAKEAFNAYFRPVGRAKFRQRIKTCHRCPIYDKELKRCRPYTGAPVGCGCFVPYKALAKEACWARQRNPDKGWD